MQPSLASHRNAGFGLGLRTAHYPDFQKQRQPVDWLEIISDNFLVDGGKPLQWLDQIRRDYPMVMHGVAMSIGEAAGVDEHYLRRIKVLADRVQPLWVSDHLCWSGTGRQRLHDLYPLPYTDESARHVIAQIRRVQDVLGRRFVVENVSSYIEFRDSACAEWQFLNYVAQEADCLLLLDVNNVYVSAANHGFDPLRYLAGLPAHRIQQIHLAGHNDDGELIIDTHDHPVAPAVWDLYRQACRMFGTVPAMIERDDNIPALAELTAELQLARTIAREASASPAADHDAPISPPLVFAGVDPHANVPAAAMLETLQAAMTRFVLAQDDDAAASRAVTRGSADARTGLAIYRNAYSARIAETLADTFERVTLFMGQDRFEGHAREFALLEVPDSRSLSRYGESFVGHLARCYPGHDELRELAQLDWDLRHCFDSADHVALSAEQAAADREGEWLLRAPILHPTLRLRSITTNMLSIWRAIDADEDVPPVEALAVPLTLAVWRKGMQPHFRTLQPEEATFLFSLADGLSIAEAAERAQATQALASEQLAAWLREWWSDGFLAARSGWGASGDASEPDGTGRQRQHSVETPILTGIEV